MKKDQDIPIDFKIFSRLMDTGNIESAIRLLGALDNISTPLPANPRELVLAYYIKQADKDRIAHYLGLLQRTLTEKESLTLLTNYLWTAQLSEAVQLYLEREKAGWDSLEGLRENLVGMVQLLRANIDQIGGSEVYAIAVNRQEGQRAVSSIFDLIQKYKKFLVRLAHFIQGTLQEELLGSEEHAQKIEEDIKVLIEAELLCIPQVQDREVLGIIS